VVDYRYNREGETDMKNNLWFISDTHFNHSNILNFQDKNGKKFRGDIFSSVEEMNEIMIQNWNSLVKPQDKIYHLGDVFFGSQTEANKILSRLNGKKRLILGNHDKLNKHSILLNHFEKIMMWWPHERMIFSHVPLAKDQMRTRSGDAFNVHGHIHQNESPSKFHCNVSVEKTNFSPVHFDELVKRLPW